MSVKRRYRIWQSLGKQMLCSGQNEMRTSADAGDDMRVDGFVVR